MSDISSQLIKDSYNYVLQSDLATGVVYRIGGGIPVNPIFSSGLTINTNFNYSNGTEQPGFVLITDASGNASWGPVSGSSSGSSSGYYGAFSDVTDQFATVINTGYPMLLGVTDLSNGVTVVSGSRVTIANTGIYNIQWSGQFRNPSANIHDVTIWLRKNGVDVPGSSGVVAVTAKHGSFDGHVLPSWNFLLDAIAGDYYEFVWSTDNLAVFISFEPAGSPAPSTASVVLTVTQQSGIMAGTGITSINSLTNATQFLTVGTNTGTTFSIISSGNTHTFNTPKDIFVTGATKSGSVATFRNSTGGTFTLTGLTDVFVTGGTHSLTGGTTTFRNNTGGTFNVSGYFTPSNDIYVTSGSVDHGPSSDADNLLLLTRSDSSIVTISNLVNISDTTKSEIDSLIGDKKIIRGKTYKISGCDNSLYYNGTDERGDDVYTTIYLMGLENIKLSETGVGIFYTPQYDTYDIFVDGAFYTKEEYVIWGGYVWECGTNGTYNSIDLFTLDPAGFDIIRPFKNSDSFNKDYYNIQYDDIIYDLTNDKIIYRNEENSNIVSTTYENINYWIDDMGLYNPIRAFQWGNVSYVLNSKTYGIGNQRIINSYNENINYRGQFQKYFYFNNLSHQNNLYVEDPLCYQSNFIFDNKSYQSVITLISNGYQSDITLNNGSYQTSISFQGVDGFPSNQSFFNFNNGSYQDNIVIRSGDGAPGNQSYFNFNNSSYQININLREREQNRLDFTNNSGQDTIDGCNQESLIFDSSTQVNGNGFNQLNITIKNYDRDLSSVSVNEQDEYYIHNLPSDDTAPVYIGKINNRLVEVTKPVDIFVTGGTYSSGTSTITFRNNTGGTFNVSGITSSGGGTFTGGTVTGATIFTGGLTANTISATTITSPSISPYGLIVATSIGYQNIF